MASAAIGWAAGRYAAARQCRDLQAQLRWLEHRLGLAIVRHIVNRHRGRLAIDSTEGVGSTASVWLPT